MTATATPRTDKFYDEVSDRESHDDGTNPNWSEPSKWSYEAILDLVDFARKLETELAAMTAENAELLAALEEIKGRVQFGVSTHMSSDVVKLCNEAIAKGKA